MPWPRRSSSEAELAVLAELAGCPTLAASLFLRLGWDAKHERERDGLYEWINCESDSRGKGGPHQLHGEGRFVRRAALRLPPRAAALDEVFDFGGVAIAPFQRQRLFGLAVKRGRTAGGEIGRAHV